MNLFRIKICGVARPEDAAAAAEAGADAIGLNFYEKSPRFIDLAQAEAISAALPPGVQRVGVFVNADPAEIRGKFEALQLDWVQLHGDEPPQILMELAGIPVIRGVRLKPGQRVMDHLLPASGELVRLPSALLIDAYSPSEYGGTGKTVDWPSIPAVRTQVAGLPIILAGGLTPENVAQAIATARPDAVDVSSGVEDQPGVKNREKLRSFVDAARQAMLSAK